MRRLLILLIVTMSLIGCAAKPPFEGYSGPTTYVRDTSKPRGARRVDFFYLAEVDGQSLPQSLDTTERRNYGRGFHMDPVVVGRNIPMRPATVRIVGRTHYAAPILALMNKVYEVSRTIRVTPVEGFYVVNGVLGDDYSAGWIEDGSGRQVGEKVEVKGPSTLGFFEK